MPSSSADPADLRRLAAALRSDGERLLQQLHPFEEEMRSLWLRSDRRFLGPFPDIDRRCRRIGHGLLHRARETDRVGRAFELADRCLANRDRISHDLGALPAAGRPGTAEAARLRALLHDHVLIYDPVRGHVAVVFGDLARATHVAIVVEGMNRPFSTFLGGARRDARRLASTMERQARSRTATIAWLGYDSPSYREVTSRHDASRGGHRLAAFVRSLDLQRGQELTLVGHSYGSIVVAEAQHAGAGARNLVLLGSPGVADGSFRLRRLARHARVYAERAPGDLVGDTEAFGTDPALPGSGATRLTTNRAGRPRVEGHSQYFEPRSQALENIAAVATGGKPQVQKPSPGEKVIEVQEQLDELTDPFGRTIEGMVAAYHGPGHELLDLRARLHRVKDGAAHLVERTVIDGGAGLIGAIIP